MKKEIQVVDKERGIVQITTLDSRFYAMPAEGPLTGLPRYEFRPSVTYICDYYPKGPRYEIWLKKNGEEADQIARLAADRGYVVHRAVAQLNAGETVKMTDVFQDQDGCSRQLTPEEYFAVMTYSQWWKEKGKECYDILGFEYTIWPDAALLASEQGISEDAFLYAGTVDLKVRRKSDQTIGVIDLKTSLDIWPSHEMQVSAYQVAERADWCAILQLNYRRNKSKKYKFTEITPCFPLFLHTKAIWKRETEGVVPQQREYPLEIKL